jgi:hypothetical protein
MMPEPGVLLLWGLPSTSVPAPVAEAMVGGLIRVERVATAYAAAERLVVLGSSARAILVDSALLTANAAGALAMLQRHALVPIISVPGGYRSRSERSMAGVMAWSEAGILLGRILQSCTEAGHGVVSNAVEDSRGKAVTSPSPQRYDGADVQPLLTEQEMRALLGPLE